MKINRVTPIHAGQFLFVRIETDSGIHGIGEGGSWGQIEAAAAAITKFASYLEGQDPFPIERHWNVMHRFSYFQGLAINAAISAIDIALWDIKGKALGVPVYELLGGAVRTSARVYGHVYEKTIEGVLADLKRKKDMGFTAVGHINPFLDAGEDQVYFEPHASKMRVAIDNVRRMREAAGDEMDLCIEIHRRLTPAEAVVFARGIEQFHPMFIEDPMRFEDADAMARIAEKIHIPIATGERFSTIYEFQALFTRKAVEYARADICLCGGITGGRKIAAMAEAHNVMMAPHNPLSPVGLAACLQIDAAIPNFTIQEYTTGFEDGIMKSVQKHLGHDVVDDVPVPVDGFVAIPDRPGIGIDLVDDPAAVRPPLSKPVIMRSHRDGSPVDQ
ncbi:MAG: mandelate racemase/muconate lactonizing enzyme family protein [Alphaproteobacteria bacterium]|nr:mandelate racemase/muconate lactonizing enzyme family protein [Alphaproteobacteria bacterium]